VGASAGGVGEHAVSKSSRGIQATNRRMVIPVAEGGFEA
jgi:hypothetical protein